MTGARKAIVGGVELERRIAEWHGQSGPLAAFAVLAALPSAAAAQSQPVQSTSFYAGGQEAWDVLSFFGDCYASQQSDDAIKLVSTKPDSVEEAKAYKQLVAKQNQPCLGYATSMHVSYQMVRGAIAEGLYRHSKPLPAALAVTTAPSVSQVRNFMDAALCFTATHRDEVRKLLATTHLGTKAEDEAVTALLPGLNACVPPNARKISITSPMIRVRLAEAMWRLGETRKGHAPS